MMPFCDLRPRLTSLFSPRATPNGILLFSFAFPVCRVPFRPSQPERNFIFNTAYPPSARHFHPRKAPKGIIFPCIPHLPRPFSPSKSPKGNFIFNSAFPVCRDLFYPRAVPNGILFSHSTSIPLRRGPRLQRCITIFSVLSAAFHHAGHRVSLHAEYIQRSCPKCVAQHRNGEIFPPANATAATNRGAGGSGRTRWIQEKTVSIGAAGDILYWDYRRGQGRQGIYYTGIIGRERSSRSIIHGFSASEGVAGI